MTNATTTSPEKAKAQEKDNNINTLAAEEELKITILPPVDKGPADEPVPVGGGGDEGAEPSGEQDEPQPEQPAES